MLFTFENVKLISSTEDEYKDWLTGNTHDILVKLIA